MAILMPVQQGKSGGQADKPLSRSTRAAENLRDEEVTVKNDLRGNTRRCMGIAATRRLAAIKILLL